MKALAAVLIAAEHPRTRRFDDASGVANGTVLAADAHLIPPPALLALAFVLIFFAPAASANLVGHHVRFDAMYAGSTFISTVVTVVDPGIEISCATPTSTGPGCGANINQGGYTIDLQDAGILFRTSASFGSQYGPDRNLLRFTLLDSGFQIVAASLVASDVPGLVAGRVTFTSSSVTLDLSGLAAPAVESTSIAVTVSATGAQIAPNPNPLGHLIDVLALLLNNSAFDNLGKILVELAGSLQNYGILTNEGTIDNLGSLINALGGTIGSSGTLTNESGATLTNNGSLSNSGGGPTGNGSGVTNAGTITNNGTLTNTGDVKVDVNGVLDSIGNIINSGNLDNRGGWFTSGTVQNAGTVVNEVKAVLDNSGLMFNGMGTGQAIMAYFENAGALINSGTIDNWGVLRNDINGMLTNSKKIINEADAQIQNMGNLVNEAIGSTLGNDGTVTNSGTVSVGPNGTVTGSGTYTQTAGTTTVDGTMSQSAVNIAAGILKGVGAVSGSVSNGGGTVAPGDSPGTLTINGSYTQHAGTLKIWVAGTAAGQYSTLIVNGVADLSGGTLQLSFISGFAPRVGDQWQVLKANTLVGFDPAGCRLDGLLQGSAISCRQSGNAIVATVTAVTGSGATYTVPIVLSSGGLNSSFFTSEMALTNRGTTDATITYAYTAAFGGSNGTATDILPAGRQKLVPDAIAYLSGLGIPVGGSGNRGGTLQVNFSGLSSTDAGAATIRTTTAVPEGRAGLAYGGLPSSKLLSAPVYLCGLRQNETDRSNVAVMNAGSPGEGNITLRLTVISGDPSHPAIQALSDVVLSPGGFSQISGILASNGLSLDNGYVKVERVAGSAPFQTYGVINDQANSDGSFVEPILANPAAAVTGATLPVVVETSTFATELVVTNSSAKARTLTCTYVASALPGGQVTFGLALLPNEQQIFPAIVQVLRSRGVISGQPGPTYVGALFVTDSTGDLRGVSIGARTSSAGGGGRYGLFYSAVPAGAEATKAAWLYGLQQNAENRTNLALVNVGSTDSTTDTIRIDLFDGATGQKVGTADNITVPAKGFLQLNAILSQYAPSVSSGYSLVTRTAGNNPFITYAVINDGGQPGQRTGDGAFVSASVPRP